MSKELKVTPVLFGREALLPLIDTAQPNHACGARQSGRSTLARLLSFVLALHREPEWMPSHTAERTPGLTFDGTEVTTKFVVTPTDFCSSAFTLEANAYDDAFYVGRNVFWSHLISFNLGISTQIVLFTGTDGEIYLTGTEGGFDVNGWLNVKPLPMDTLQCIVELVMRDYGGERAFGMSTVTNRLHVLALRAGAELQ